MVFDKLENVGQYKGISKRLDIALDTAANTYFSQLENGKYEVDGDDIFYMVQRYDTKQLEKGKLEAHRKYIDIQIVVAGRELIGTEILTDQKIQQNYDNDNDVVFYEPTDVLTMLKFNRGMFCVLWPDDLHMPGLSNNKEEQVTKVVFKVRV